MMARTATGLFFALLFAGTALADDPDLTPRPPRGGRQWDWKRVVRVVLDSRLRLPTAGQTVIFACL